MSVTPSAAPYRPAYLRASDGLYYKIGVSGGGGGTGGLPVYVGQVDDNPDPAAWSQWVVTTDAGPWDAPLAAGTYSLRVSNGTTWFEIAGGGGGPTGTPPTAAFTATVTHWSDVSVDATASSDPDGFVTAYEWNWGDGSALGSGITASHTYATSGTYTISLTITDNDSLQDLVTHPVTVVRMYGPVAFTTKGATFAPKLWQITDSPNSIEWINAATSAVLSTSATPSINFGTAGTRTVNLYCSRPQDVLTLNVGYNTGHDTGNYLPGINGGESNPNNYNLAPQRVTAITGYNTVFTNLVHFMAAGNPDDGTLGTDVLTGATNFSGMSHLEHIECAYARCNSTNLTGCTSLIRLCFEQNQWQGGTLDLNPVRTNLRDLRMAFQNGVVFTALSGPLTALYHLCVRQQPITNMPVYPNLPALTEHWTWETGQSGAFVAPALTIDARLGDNAYTSLDFSHCTGQTSFGQFDVANNSVTSITGLSTMPHFQQAFFNANGMGQALVNSILTQVNAWGQSGGTLWLNGGAGAKANASPTGGTGNAAYVALQGRGYDVRVN